MAYFRNNGSGNLKCDYEEKHISTITKKVKYLCFAYDGNSDNEINNDDNLGASWHFYIKDTGIDDLSNMTTEELKDSLFEANGSGLAMNISELINAEKYIDNDNNSYRVDHVNNNGIYCISDDGANDAYLRYPEGDIEGEERVSEIIIEPKTETITEIIPELNIKKLGKEYTAPEGKAWKKIEVTKPDYSFSLLGEEEKIVYHHYYSENFDEIQIDLNSVSEKNVLYSFSCEASNIRQQYAYFIGDGINTIKDIIFANSANLNIDFYVKYEKDYMFNFLMAHRSKTVPCITLYLQISRKN